MRTYDLTENGYKLFESASVKLHPEGKNITLNVFGQFVDLDEYGQDVNRNGLREALEKAGRKIDDKMRLAQLREAIGRVVRCARWDTERVDGHAIKLADVDIYEKQEPQGAERRFIGVIWGLTLRFVDEVC